MSEQQPEAVVLHVENGIADVMLNRPDRRNAISGPLGIDLATALEEASGREDVRVVLLRGSGGAFCSGLDLDAFNADPPPAWQSQWPAIWRRAHSALFNCPHPVVAAMERYAINGGAALAIAADLLIVGEQSWLQVGEARQGMGAPYNLAWLRLRHPESVSARLTLTGRRFAGQELCDLGIAYECVADDAIGDRAHELAVELAGYPANALRRIKAGLRCYTPDDADAWFDRVFASDPAPGQIKPRKQD